MYVRDSILGPILVTYCFVQIIFTPFLVSNVDVTSSREVFKENHVS